MTGDVEKDLKTITLRLQAEAGGAAVRYDQAPLLQAWSDADGGRAWLVRGEVDQQNRVPTWMRQGIVSITVGKLTQLPKEPTQKSLSDLVDEHYGDLQVVKREAKKRDVLSFALGMSDGDLVATVDGGALRLGVVQDEPGAAAVDRRHDAADPGGGLVPGPRARGEVAARAASAPGCGSRARTSWTSPTSRRLADLRPEDEEAERPDDLDDVDGRAVDGPRRARRDRGRPGRGRAGSPGV